MAKITFSKLNIKPIAASKVIDLYGGNQVEVRAYLPMSEKIEFINFIVNHALDDVTGCFSPVRTEVSWCIGLCKWYAGISFTDKQLEAANITKVYDSLITTGVYADITAAIPAVEREMMRDLVNDTLKDIAAFNTSLKGMIRYMNNDAENLDSQLKEILSQMKDPDIQKTLDAIK